MVSDVPRSSVYCPGLIQSDFKLKGELNRIQNADVSRAAGRGGETLNSQTACHGKVYHHWCNTE